MRRETIKLTLDLTVADNKRRLLSTVGILTGMYDVALAPRRPTRSLRQNAAWWGLIVQPFYEFLRDQDIDISDPEQAHAILREKLLRVAVVSRRTGEVIAWRTRSTTELNTNEFAELYDKAQVWLADQFGIVVPDPDPQTVGAA